MTTPGSPEPSAPSPGPVARSLGEVVGASPGPTLVVTAGLHGNEPAGVHAVRRVIATLEERRVPLAGRLVGLAGNVAALTRGVRFVSRDLNRGWDDAAAERLLGARAEDLAHEELEQHELLRRFVHLEREARGPLVFLDLHSTSGGGAPFVCMADTLPNRPLALGLGLPVILGLEEVIEGAMLGWVAERGHAAIAVEGGQHEDPGAIDVHEASIWSIAVSAGLVARERAPRLREHRRRLAEARGGLPRVVEVRHRHVVAPNDEFVMDPGWASFQPIRAGQVVARDRRGPIAAERAGRMLMPRYQAQGEDGFFLVRDVRPLWLHVSTLLRHLGAERLVRRLPGVQPEPGHPDRLVVDPRVARARVTEIMHLCGYRRSQPRGDRLVYTRRRQGPAPVAPGPLGR